jgi:hypothetical protein
MPESAPLQTIRFWLVLFMVGLVLSGVTAFPLVTEIHWLVGVLSAQPLRPIAEATHLLPWILLVNRALTETGTNFPFLAYGTDWLAFAHLVLAVAFVGPWREPVRNRWVIDFGLIACAGVLPLALIAGQVRGIPLGWRLIDCCFGVFGALPLWRCRVLIDRMEQETVQAPPRIA